MFWRNELGHPLIRPSGMPYLWLPLMVMPALLVLLLLLWSAPAAAQPITHIALNESCLPAVAGGYGPATYVAVCIEKTLEMGISYLIPSFAAIFMPVIVAAVTLSVTLFGIKMALGALQDPRAEGMLLVVKVGMVFFFTQTMDYWYALTLQLMNGVVDVMTSEFFRAFRDAGSAEGACLFADTRTIVDAAGVQKLPGAEAWRELDCVAGRVLGLGFALGLASGLLSFVFAALFSGGVGLIVFLIGVFTLMTTLFVLCRAVYSHVMCQIALLIVATLAVVVLPGMLFTWSNEMTKKWVTTYITYTCRCIFMFGAIVIGISAYNSVAFTGQYSIYRAFAGAPGAAPDFNLGRYLTEGDTEEEKIMVFRALFESYSISTDGTELIEQTEMQDTPWWGNVPVISDVAGLLTSVRDNVGNLLKISLETPQVNFERMAEKKFGAGRTSGIDIFRLSVDITVSMIATVAMGYLMAAIMRVASVFEQTMIGSPQMPSADTLAPMFIEPQMRNMVSGGLSTVSASASGQRGLLMGGGTAGLRGYTQGVRNALTGQASRRGG